MNKFGFIVLAPEPNTGLVKTSEYHLCNYDMKVVVPEHIDNNVYEKLSELAKVVRGGNTITSLINAGFEGAQGWQIIVMAGVPINAKIIRKLDVFIKNEKDVFFPIVPDFDRRGRMARLNSNFSNCTLNGIAIHSDTFREVGPFVDDPDIQYVRLCWACAALEIGCHFKGVVGMRMN